MVQSMVQVDHLSVWLWDVYAMTAVNYGYEITISKNGYIGVWEERSNLPNGWFQNVSDPQHDNHCVYWNPVSTHNDTH